MEKEQPDSMATVAIKPEYTPSEYSSSEPPPAYRKPMSSAVQIARIAALTIVASSFILGAFILASAWVQARAGCQQLDQLDAMLDKELALEGRAYGNDALVPEEPHEPLPVSAHALHAAPPAAASQTQDKTRAEESIKHAESKINEDKLQKLDDDKENSPADESSAESDSSDSDEDDELDAAKNMLRLPIQFDLDDLAGAFLANTNQKGRMNCVVERRHEEIMEKRFPFNLLGVFANKPEPTSERIAIICHGGDDKAEFPEPAAQVFAFPLTGPPRMPVRPPPPAMQPPAPARHRAAPFPLPMSWDSSEDQAPPREMRIHVQRIIAIPARNAEPNMPFGRPDEDGPFSRPQDMMFPRQDMPFNRPQNMPFNGPQDMPFERPQEVHFARPIQPFQRQEPPRPEMPRPHMMVLRPQEGPSRSEEGLRQQETAVLVPRPTADQVYAQHQEQNEPGDVMTQFFPQPQQPIQEIENPEKVQVESLGIPMNLPWGLTTDTLRAIHRHAVESDRQDAADNERQDDPEAEQQQIDNDMQEVKTIVNTLAAAAAAEMEGAAHQSQETSQPTEPQEQAVRVDAPVIIQREERSEERPHYVQPRSVRSVDALLHREKRVKRCSCDCA